MLRQKIRQHLDAGGARAAGRRHQMHRAFGLLPAFQDHFDLARGDGVADDEVRQVGDAEAGDDSDGNSASPLLTRSWPAGRTLACSPAALV